MKSWFSWLLFRFGRDWQFVLGCEVVIFLVEWALLVAIYGRRRWRYLGLLSLVVNTVSCGTGVLMELVK